MTDNPVAPIEAIQNKESTPPVTTFSTVQGQVATTQQLSAVQSANPEVVKVSTMGEFQRNAPTVYAEMVKSITFNIKRDLDNSEARRKRVKQMYKD